MEERTELKIKKENKKAFVKFMIILFFAMVFGGIVGGLSQIFGEEIGVLLKTGLTQIVGSMSLYGIYGCSILLLGASWIIYFQCKSKLKNKELDEDEVLDLVEMKLNYPLLFSNICMILDFFFFAGGITELSDLRQTGLNLLGFILSIGIIVLIQQKIIDLLRVLNPEKKGSVYDMNFSHKWEESCDEAEKLMMYKASYTSFRFTAVTCIVLWLVLAIASNTTDIGILPVTCVMVIWMVQTVSYCIASIRMTKSKQNKKDN